MIPYSYINNVLPACPWDLGEGIMSILKMLPHAWSFTMPQQRATCVAALMEHFLSGQCLMDLQPPFSILLMIIYYWESQPLTAVLNEC